MECVPAYHSQVKILMECVPAYHSQVKIVTECVPAYHSQVKTHGMCACLLFTGKDLWNVCLLTIHR